MRAASTAERNFIATFYMWVLSSPGHWSESLEIGKYVTHQQLRRNISFLIWRETITKCSKMPSIRFDVMELENLARILQTVATGAERWSRPGELSQTARARLPSHQLPPPPLPLCHPATLLNHRLTDCVCLAIIIIHNLWHPSLSPTPDQWCLISSTWKQQVNNIKGPQNQGSPWWWPAIFSWFLSWNSDSSWALPNRPNWQCLWAIN